MAFAERSGKGWRARWKGPPGSIPEWPSKSGFTIKKTALEYGQDREAEIRAGTYIDPNAGKITLAAWWAKWLPAQHVADTTVDKYTSLYGTHLAPRWGRTSLLNITNIEIETFRKDLLTRRAQSTVQEVMGLLRMMLTDAVTDRLIPALPMPPPGRRRRGSRTVVEKRQGIAVAVETVLKICQRLNPQDALMVLTAAFTGMRWGEVAGMRRKYLMLQPEEDGHGASGYYVIDDKDGAVKERKGRRYFGSPKGGKGRTIELPGFLVGLLLDYLEQLPAAQELLFPDNMGNPWRRGGFGRGVWRPACDGWPEQPTVRGHAGYPAEPPIVKAMRFHDLRHTHATWMDEDAIRQPARDERLGHLPQGIRGVYDHPTPQMRADILAGLTKRWESVDDRERI